MEKMRRIASGRLSEILGVDTLEIDKFMRSVGLRRSAKISHSLLSDEEKEVLQAYSDGINDFVSGVGLYSADSTARLLPPEFKIFGIT